MRLSILFLAFVASSIVTADPLPGGHKASLVFKSFLECSQKNDQGQANCANQYFSKKLKADQINHFQSVLYFPNANYKLFKCSPERARLIKIYESKASFDFFYCFKSNLTKAKRDGTVFFVEELGPKIINLKL
jgi:hypothetical protein